MNALKFIPVVLVSCWASCAGCSQLPVELSDYEVVRAKFALADATGKSMEEMEGLIRESDKYVTWKFIEFEEDRGIISGRTNHDSITDEDISKYVKLYKTVLFDAPNKRDRSFTSEPYQWLLDGMNFRAAEARSLGSIIRNSACAVFTCKCRPYLGSVVEYMASVPNEKSESDILNSPNCGPLNELMMIYQNISIAQYLHAQNLVNNTLGRIFNEVMDDRVRYIENKG
ncbi:MAG: hypothetical protein LBQ43_05350 [Holosporales bacterium]|nr:hypothetical protein [Holosporales bacterium]